MAEQTESQKKGFSVALGLIDFINPVTYTINTILILGLLKSEMTAVEFICYLAGVAVSVIIGLIIPTGKLLVGLGKMEFKLPYVLFLICNIGILVTGASVFSAIASTKVFLIALAAILVIIFGLWAATKKFNTAIMFTATLGYTLIYIALILRALKVGAILPLVLFALCWCIMMSIIILSMCVDLRNPKFHWPIEGGNISTQIILMIGLIVLRAVHVI